MSDAEARTREVSSRDDPAGRSSTTCSSDLLSKGRSLTVTVLVANMAQATSVATPTPSRNFQAEARVAITRPATLR